VTDRRQAAINEMARRAQNDPQKVAALKLFDRIKDNPKQIIAFKSNARARGVDLTFIFGPEPKPTPRQELFREKARGVNPVQAAAVGFGKGLENIGRGIGIIDEPTPVEQEADIALQTERPFSTGFGEIAGEAAPFVIPGAQVGAIPSIAGRLAAAGLLGATEGAIVSAGTGQDELTGAGIGAVFSIGAEALFPLVGKLGKKVVQKATGKPPKGALIDSFGQPTQELQDALKDEGLLFDTLVDDAVRTIKKSKPGTDMQQAARRARFQQEEIPASRGEITQFSPDVATEQKLLQTVQDSAAEPFKQFKLQQSEAIKERLASSFGFDVTEEETGQLIQDALTGRKKLLRSQKNDLYTQIAKKAEDIGGVPIFTENIEMAIPEKKIMRRLSRIQGNQVAGVEDLLTEFGMGESHEAIEKFIKSGGEVTPLDFQNFEDFRIALNTLERADQTGASSVAIGPIRDALDKELIEIGDSIPGQKLSQEILIPLREARKRVRELKIEFDPKSFVGQLVDTKKKSAERVTEASKVYDKIIAKSMPIESVRKTVSSLGKSGDQGKEAIASLQASTLFDLIDAGFGTDSKKISGVKIFNPVAFRRRLKNIGRDKINAIFRGSPGIMKRLNNIDRIASDLIPRAEDVPKGSAAIILDIADKIGLTAIATRTPLVNSVLGTVKASSDIITKGVDVRKALGGKPDVIKNRSLIDKMFPGIASAIAIPAAMAANKNLKGEK